MTQYGMSTQQHDAIDKSALDKYFSRVYDRALAHKGGTIVDAFSGGGRDIIRMCDLLENDGNFLGIDSDAQKVIDMLAKNVSSQELVDNETCIELAVSQDEIDRIFNNDWIAAVQGRFPDTPLGNHASKSGIDLNADFMLCNAGIMFVKPDDLEATLQAMAGILAEKGELVLRFSLARDDKQKALGTSYFIHDPDTVKDILEGEGVLVKRHDDLADPDGRPFTWVDMQVLKP